MKFVRSCLAPAAFIAVLAGAHSAARAQVDAETFETWGLETVAQTEATLGKPGSPLYIENRNLNTGQTSEPWGASWIWPLSTQFRTFNQLVELDPGTYTPQLRSLADAMHNGYWNVRQNIHGTGPIGGYSSGKGGGDRFYDDNAHLVVGYAEAFRLTADPVYLNRAKATHDFVLSGEWFETDGSTEGIRFVENGDDRSSNTISVLQGARGAAMIYQLTGEQRYLDDAVRLVDWADDHLQQAGGRYWQGWNVDTNQAGGVDIVNGTADGIAAHLELYQATGEEAYLDEAERIAHAAVGRFVNPNTSAFNDEGMWAFELAEAFNDLTLETGDERWLNHTRGALAWLRENKMDGNGHYGRFWGRNGPFNGTHHLIELNNMAPVAHAYLDTAATMYELQAPVPEPTSAAVLMLPGVLMLLRRRGA